ncbi:hypothetical protein, partial [Paraglaciecola sp.]|uniref:hypothetical protein n=1 Tax=Paraglaciecola sp. TaxID=1920173 RepID=UPI0030F41DEE
FCSSGQCFAFDFLQISPRDEHPCRSANYSPCRANSGLSPPNHLTATTRIRTAPNMGATHHTWRTIKNAAHLISGGINGISMLLKSTF